MFENLGPAELLLIFLVILIFFGPKKIPELAASLGKGLRKFNDAKDGLETQIKTVMKEPLDAINEAKAGLETKLMDASQPLRESMMPNGQFATATVGGVASAAAPDARVVPQIEAMPLPPTPIDQQVASPVIASSIVAPAPMAPATPSVATASPATSSATPEHPAIEPHGAEPPHVPTREA